MEVSNMAEYTLKGAPKPVNILAEHTGSTTKVSITGIVVDGVTRMVGYYTVKAGQKLKLYEFDVAAGTVLNSDSGVQEAVDTRVFIEECTNVTTTPLTWVTIKGLQSTIGSYNYSAPLPGRSWRYPLIIEAYEYDIGIRLSYQQSSGAQVDISMHGEVSSLRN